MKASRYGVRIAFLGLALAAILFTERARAADDILGKTIRYSRSGVSERVEIRILKNGRVFLKSDGTNYSSDCPGGGNSGVEGTIGRTHSYARGCGGNSRTSTTRISYKDGVLTINDEYKAGHTFYATYRIKISGGTCSGSQSGGYRSANGHTAAPTYSLSRCVVE